MSSLARIAAAVLLAAMLPAAVWAAAPVVTYGAPAGGLPAGRLPGAVAGAVLPSGRLVTPEGRSVVVGSNAQAVALSPDGRYAIVSNADERAYSLAVVDTGSMTVVDRYRGPSDTFYAGIAALRDPLDQARTLVLATGGPSNSVAALTLDAGGHLGADLRAIAIPGALDPSFADAGRSFPAAIVAAPDGRHAYVVNNLGNSVCTIDTATRTVAGTPRSVGFFPFGAALAGPRLLVTNEGLMRYRVLGTPATAPAFHMPPPDLTRASSLSLLAIDPDGNLSQAAQDAPPFVAAVPMDPSPDGLRTAGGAHPSAVVATRDGAYAFVAMSGVDRVAAVALGPAPHSVGGVELRLFDRGPYGTQPTALALSRDGSRLYVALTGLDAIAVIDARDPAHLHRLGLIPTGWSPSALALAANDRTLFVTNAKGFGDDAGVSSSTLQRIDLAQVKLADATRATLAATRRVLPAAPHYPKAIRNVVVILSDSKTFDAMLGDLGYGPADPSLAAFGEAVTPNLHALARRFAVAGNFFAEAEEPDAGHQYADAGMATAYTERNGPLRSGRRPFTGQNPEDYPRAGYIYHALARHNLSFRDYGDLLHTGSDDVRFTLDVPAPAVLDGHVDLRYPGVDPRVRDTQRAEEFVRDFGALPGVPRFTAIALPGDGAGTAEAAADTDRALGTIVAYLTTLPSWRATTIFVLRADAQGGRDHVDAHRSYALVVSPYAKRRFVGMRHTSTASVLKTIDGLFELPALSLGDLLATDLSDYFTTAADVRPFEAILR